MQREEINAELKPLWERRDTLSEREWVRLRELIHCCLQSSGKIWSLYSSLSGDESLADYIDHFIADRVFKPTTREDAPPARLVHANAIIGFFWNYLVEVYRRQAWFVDSRFGNNDVDDIDKLQALHHSGVESSVRANPGEDEFQALEFIGRSREHVTESARAWFAAQERWVRLYLVLHHCPESWERMPLDGLARLYDIPSHHHRARKLGITSQKGGFESYDAFEKTLLGQWLVSLPIEIRPEDYQAMREALEILCLVALSEHEANPEADV